MKIRLSLTLALLLAVASVRASANLNILACEPEWGALAKELGGDKVTVYTATTALQDPHQVQARPSLIAHARNADLLACTGAELEVGWLPILLRQSGNPRIQPGQPGSFAAANYVQKLEVPTRLDRSEGDVHATGNPHIQTDPRNIGLAAAAMAKSLALIDPANAGIYQDRYRNFAARWQAAEQRWEHEAALLKGVAVVVHHRGWVYLERWLGLRDVGELEPKPGVEPTASHLEELLGALQRQPARIVIRAAYNDARPSEWLADRAHIEAVVLPFTVGGSDGAQDLFGLFDDTVKRLLQAAKP